MPKLELEITSDAAKAERGIKRVKDEISDANKEQKKFVAEGDAVSDMAEEWIRNAKAIEENAAAIRKARVEQRRLQQEQREKSRAASAAGMGIAQAVGAGGLVSRIAGAGTMASGISAMGPVAGGAAVVGAVAAPQIMAANKFMQREASLAAIDQYSGGRSSEIHSAAADLASDFQASTPELLIQSERLLKAGFTTEQAIDIMRHAVVAARGDLSKMEGIFDELVEAASRGYLEEGLLGKMDENAIEARRALMDHLNMSKEQLDAALAAGEINVHSYLEIMDQLTGKGTEAFEAANAAADVTINKIASISSKFEELLVVVGKFLKEGFVDYIAKPLGLDKMLDWADDALDSVRETLSGPDPNKAFDWVQTPTGFQGENTPDKIQQKFEANQALSAQERDQAAAQANMAELVRLKNASLNAKNAATWAGMSTAEKRQNLATSTGLGDNLSIAAIDQAIASSSGMAAMAAGEAVSSADVDRMRALTDARKKLLDLERAEAAERASLQKQQDLLDAAEKRRALQEAELAGDKQKLQHLKDQQEAEKLYEQYKAAGLSQEEAMEKAAAESERLIAIRSMKNGESVTPSVGGEVVRSTGWLSSSLADVGGGGARIRQYEGGAIEIARKTEAHTESISLTADQILEHLKNSQSGLTLA